MQLLLLVFSAMLAFLIPVLVLLQGIQLCSKVTRETIYLDGIWFLMEIMMFFYLAFFYQGIDYQEQLVYSNIDTVFHTPLASWHMPTFLFIYSVALLAYALVYLRKGKLSPLLLTLGFAEWE